MLDNGLLSDSLMVPSNGGHMYSKGKGDFSGCFSEARISTLSEGSFLMTLSLSNHFGVRVLAHEFAYFLILKELLMCPRFQSPYMIPKKVAEISDRPEQYSLLFKCETRLQLTRPDDKSSVLSIVLLTVCRCIPGEKYLLAPERHFGCSNIAWGRKENRKIKDKCMVPRLLWKTSVFCAALEDTDIAGSDCSVSQMFVSNREAISLNINVAKS